MANGNNNNLNSIAEQLTGERGNELLRKMQMRGENREVLRGQKGQNLMHTLQAIAMYLSDYKGLDRDVSGGEKDIARNSLEGVRNQIRSDSRQDFDYLFENYTKNFPKSELEGDDYDILRNFLGENTSYEPIRWPQDAYSVFGEKSKDADKMKEMEKGKGIMALLQRLLPGGKTGYR